MATGDSRSICEITISSWNELPDKEWMLCLSGLPATIYSTAIKKLPAILHGTSDNKKVHDNISRNILEETSIQKEIFFFFVVYCSKFIIFVKCVENMKKKKKNLVEENQSSGLWSSTLPPWKLKCFITLDSHHIFCYIWKHTNMLIITIWWNPPF